MPKKTLLGVVTSDKLPKTRRVDVERLERHARYGKYIRRRTVCYVHDENNESRLGDRVEIIECRPRSKSKRWELLRVVAHSTEAEVQAQRTAAQEEAAQDTAGEASAS